MSQGFRIKVLRFNTKLLNSSVSKNTIHIMSSSWFTLNYLIDVENEDTLHLVERQPQPSTGSSSGEAISNNGMRGSKENCIFL